MISAVILKKKLKRPIFSFWVWVFFVLCTFSHIKGGEPPNVFEKESDKFLTPDKVSGYKSPELRTFEEAALKKFQSDPDYQYHRSDEKVSFIGRFLQWLHSLIERFFPRAGVNKTFDVLQYVLIAFILVLLVSLLLNVPINKLFFRRNSRSVGPAYEVIDENIHELDFEALISESLKQQDYRKAVRLNYLKALKQLSDKELIAWEAYKTNKDYQSELRQSRLYKPFTNITRAFNYVWYGNFTIKEFEYSSISLAFEQFGSLIKAEKI